MILWSTSQINDTNKKWRYEIIGWRQAEGDGWARTHLGRPNECESSLPRDLWGVHGNTTGKSNFVMGVFETSTGNLSRKVQGIGGCSFAKESSRSPRLVNLRSKPAKKTMLIKCDVMMSVGWSPAQGVEIHANPAGPPGEQDSEVSPRKTVLFN